MLQGLTGLCKCAMISCRCPHSSKGHSISRSLQWCEKCSAGVAYRMEAGKQELKAVMIRARDWVEPLVAMGQLNYRILLGPST